MPDKAKQEVCPLLGAEGWEAECERIHKYYCPFASIPQMKVALEKDLPECPLSWQVEE